MNISGYLRQLESHFRTGRATEHSHRPALQTLLEEAIPDAKVINEPRQIIDCGAPDFVLTRNNIPLGYVEAKDLDKNLDDRAFREQLQRYSQSLDNLLFTNYLEFRLFRDGSQVETVHIGALDEQRIRAKQNQFTTFHDIIGAFSSYQGHSIASAAELAKRMAHKARLLARVITRALEASGAAQGQLNEMDSTLQSQWTAFQEHLIHDLSAPAFADMYAQTVAYGMFAARLHDTGTQPFSRHVAAEHIPLSNPFLRKFFQHIAGYDLDPRIRWIVDELADLFRATDVAELMKEYGKATQRNDPFLHFYESFLGEYDAKLRKSRGVYYTPAPVVDFMVRAVDQILRSDFALSDGLAHTGKIRVAEQGEAGGKKQKNSAPQKEVHRVQILDPATGTGTFLAAIVRHIHENYFASQKGIWPEYAKQDLIPRLNGFEVLMASYAMAHTKLGMVLQETGCQLDQERLRIFLTNALEEHHPDTGTLFASWLATEAREANSIKRDTPVMVVIGNPPYSGISSNMSEWISKLIEIYKYVNEKHFEERKHWLHDDYVKFIRYGQYFIDKTGEGILAYINNHSFLDNPTFRGMRWNLLRSFDKIYILDLHGNAKKKEVSPDGTPDKNVFDIQQGVSINIFVKNGKKKKNKLGQVFHCDLYGERQRKYQMLWENNLGQIDFKILNPTNPHYFFIPRDMGAVIEYEKGFALQDLFPINVTGIVTARDNFVIDIEKQHLLKRILNFIDPSKYDDEIRSKYFGIKSRGKYPPGDTRGWKMVIARKKIKKYQHEELITNINYRPFDRRYIYYHPDMVDWGREKIMRHFLQGENIGLITSRITKNDFSTLCTKYITAHKSATLYDISYIFPLYLYPDAKQQSLDRIPARKPNLKPEILADIATRLSLRFTPEEEEGDDSFAPIDLLDYIYAVLHAPSYRERYRDFLKSDFPRVPYPDNKNTFRQLAKLGRELRLLHLLESPLLDTHTTTYPITGDNQISKPHYTLTDTKQGLGKIHINNSQFFGQVPKIAWNFHIGGYQPAQKWLKDRKNRPLSYQDINHYQKIITALNCTHHLMQKINTLWRHK